MAIYYSSLFSYGNLLSVTTNSFHEYLFYASIDFSTFQESRNMQPPDRSENILFQKYVFLSFIYIIFI